MEISRRKVLKMAALGGAACLGGYGLYRSLSGGSDPGMVLPSPKPLQRMSGFQGKPPNIVIIYADDMGYGDLGCYGNRAIRTPNLDRLAGEGVRFTDFYSCNALCSPARYGLLTGRYPQRAGLDWPLWQERQPLGRKATKLLGHIFGFMGVSDMGNESDVDGIPGEELTLAEALRTVGYRTGMVGKWHLGDFPELPQYHPLSHGFDEFFGVPYSNGQKPFPLYRGRERLVVDLQGQAQAQLSGLYAEEAIRFMEGSKDRPFFLYLAHTFPHRPLFASEEFRYKSGLGLYGDVVEELDHHTGRVLDYLKGNGLEDNTLVFFTSDNGPWYYGSSGGLRGGKGQSFEGGFRIPMIARWPGLIPPASVCNRPAMITDLFPTILPLAGIQPPQDRIIDGRDISGLLTGKGAEAPDRALFFYHHETLEGVRMGTYKYYREINMYKYPMPVNKKWMKVASGKLGQFPLLYDLETDPTESYNLADNRPDLVRKMEAVMNRWEASMGKNRAGIAFSPA
ncbi:MAG: sulfatase [Desulfobacterales bacterium]|nr:sulfatase [Desulfobacterales bacterium]